MFIELLVPRTDGQEPSAALELAEGTPRTYFHNVVSAVGGGEKKTAMGWRIWAVF